MNREEIAAQISQALDLIGCKHQVRNRLPPFLADVVVEVDAPGIFRLLIQDLDHVHFSYITEDGEEGGWILQISNHINIISRIWSCLYLISQRNMAWVPFTAWESLVLTLYLQSKTGTDCYVSLTVRSDDAESGDLGIKTTDPDLVAAARSFLLGHCPGDVFLDLLCEKYELFNKLRYAEQKA